jgi:hypothetical protein
MIIVLFDWCLQFNSQCRELINESEVKSCTEQIKLTLYNQHLFSSFKSNGIRDKRYDGNVTPTRTLPGVLLDKILCLCSYRALFD